MLTAHDLLLGASATHVVTVPEAVLSPASAGSVGSAGAPEPDGGSGPVRPTTVVIRPLKLADVERIHKAAQESRALTSALMVHKGLVEPELTLDQVNALHTGLAEFLLGEVSRVSGLRMEGDELVEAVQAPIARACFVLAREFGWTPDECAGLTLGQVLLYLEMLGQRSRS